MGRWIRSHASELSDDSSGAYSDVDASYSGSRRYKKSADSTCSNFVSSKLRPRSNKRNLVYHDGDVDFDEFLDEEEEEEEDKKEEDISLENLPIVLKNVVEKFLMRRIQKSKGKNDQPAQEQDALPIETQKNSLELSGSNTLESVDNDDTAQPESNSSAYDSGGSSQKKNVKYDYLVKYHNISFNHCEWLDEDTVQSLIASDRPLRTRFNNFIRKKEAGVDIPEAELVRSVPERIVDCSDPFRALYPTKAADVTRHEWTVYCLKIVDALVCCSRDHRCYGIPFLRPVDEEKDGAPGYYDIVKSPMDFITVQTKLYLRRYASPQEFWADVKKIFSNCLQYNSPRTEIAICCRYLEALFDKLYHEWACLSRANQDEAENVTKEKDLPYIESNDPNLTLQTAIQHISFYKQLKNTERTILYLVKWKNRSYTEMSWEFPCDISEKIKIAQYHRYVRVPDYVVSSKGPGYWELDLQRKMLQETLMHCRAAREYLCGSMTMPIQSLPTLSCAGSQSISKERWSYTSNGAREHLRQQYSYPRVFSGNGVAMTAAAAASAAADHEEQNQQAMLRRAATPLLDMNRFTEAQNLTGYSNLNAVGAAANLVPSSFLDPNSFMQNPLSTPNYNDPTLFPAYAAMLACRFPRFVPSSLGPINRLPVNTPSTPSNFVSQPMVCNSQENFIMSSPLLDMNQSTGTTNAYAQYSSNNNTSNYAHYSTPQMYNVPRQNLNMVPVSSSVQESMRARPFVMPNHPQMMQMPHTLSPHQQIIPQVAFPTPAFMHHQFMNNSSRAVQPPTTQQKLNQIPYVPETALPSASPNINTSQRPCTPSDIPAVKEPSNVTHYFTSSEMCEGYTIPATLQINKNTSIFKPAVWTKHATLSPSYNQTFSNYFYKKKMCRLKPLNTNNFLEKYEKVFSTHQQRQYCEGYTEKESPPTRTESCSVDETFSLEQNQSSIQQQKDDMDCMPMKTTLNNTQIQEKEEPETCDTLNMSEEPIIKNEELSEKADGPKETELETQVKSIESYENAKESVVKQEETLNLKTEPSLESGATSLPLKKEDEDLNESKHHEEIPLQNTSLKETVKEEAPLTTDSTISVKEKEETIRKEEKKTSPPLDRSRPASFAAQSIYAEQYSRMKRPKPPPPGVSRRYLVSSAYKGNRKLFDYQLDGLNWMLDLWSSGNNGILADDLGLGKTVQSMAFLWHLYTKERMRGPFLVIAPLSTLEHWRNTAEDWTDLNVILYYDENGRVGRDALRRVEWYHYMVQINSVPVDDSTRSKVSGPVTTAQIVPTSHYKFHLLLTSYEIFASDAELLITIPWQFVILDEAHKLKNRLSKTLQLLRQIACRHTLLLTGTPVQNNTEELWPLLNYIEPVRFCDVEAFKMEFGNLQTNEQVTKLTELLRPHLLRRVKEDVADSIPPLEETIIDVELTILQKAYYKAIFERNKNFLFKNVKKGQRVPNLRNVDMELRKCCNHPFMIHGVEQREYASCKTEEEKFKKLTESSGKLVLLDKLLPKLKAEGHKVLIFSQFQHTLSIIQEFIMYKGWKFERLDGQVKGVDRSGAIARFNDPAAERFIFLLSTRAGGLGINLTSADTVIIFDSDWNPQNDIQATARAHRIGQEREVKVYRLVTARTYEADMFDRASKKLGLNTAVFQCGAFDSKLRSDKHNNLNGDDKLSGISGSKIPSKEEVEELLKNGAFYLLEGNGKAAREFQENNIEEILSRNSRLVRYQLTGMRSTFSKTSFKSDKASDLSFDDPDFWKKVLNDSSSRRLLARLNDGSATVDDASMEEFMNDLQAAVEGIAAEDDPEPVIEALVQLTNLTTFSTSQRQIAEQWLARVNSNLETLQEVSNIEGGLRKDSGSETNSVANHSNAKNLTPGLRRSARVSRMEDGYRGLGSAYRGTSDEELYWLMAVEKRDKQRTARRMRRALQDNDGGDKNQVDSTKSDIASPDDTLSSSLGGSSIRSKKKEIGVSQHDSLTTKESRQFYSHYGDSEEDGAGLEDFLSDITSMMDEDDDDEELKPKFNRRGSGERRGRRRRQTGITRSSLQSNLGFTTERKPRRKRKLSIKDGIMDETASLDGTLIVREPKVTRGSRGVRGSTRGSTRGRKKSQ